MKPLVTGIAGRWTMLAVAVCGAGLLQAGAPADKGIELPISVRSYVEKPFGGFKRRPPVVHGKNYDIIALDAAEDTGALVKPVNEAELLAQVRHVLKGQGFHQITPAEKPDILLAIVYGRGLLRNPYLAGAMYNEIAEPPYSTVLAANPDQLVNQRRAGYEAKLQKANEPKLFIRLTAWKPPEASAPEAAKPKKKKEKPMMLWHTTMIYDDTRRDMNEIVKDMLAAGAPYFDRAIEDEEVEIVQPPAPAGRVDVGTPEVVPNKRSR